MAQNQRVAERIGQRADADLQRAAVAHQGAGVQADGVVGVGHRFPGQGEQARGGRGMIEHDVEKPGRHRAGAIKPGQVRVHFRDQHRSRFAQAQAFVEKVESEVGITAQAQARAAGFARDLLHQGIGATRRDRAGDVGVVEADVVALGTGRAQQRTRLHVELLDPDVGRQCVATHGDGVIEHGKVGAKLPRQEGRQEALLQALARRRRRQRKRGQQVQGQGRIRLHPPGDGVQHAVRLAQSQWRRQHQLATGMGQQAVDGGVQGRVGRGGRAWAHG